MWVKRTPLAVLLIAVFLLGGLDWHPAGDSHAGLEADGEVYLSSAEHPDHPAHFEEADPAQRPVCPVCLHRTRTSGAHLLVSAQLAPPVRQAWKAVEISDPLTAPALRPGGGRAPPSFS